MVQVDGFSTSQESCLLYHDVSSRIETEGTVSIIVDGKRLYRIGEALASASLSRATYFRWLKQGKVRDTQFKDRNGRRLFTEMELDTLKGEALRLVESPQMQIRFVEPREERRGKQ